MACVLMAAAVAKKEQKLFTAIARRQRKVPSGRMPPSDRRQMQRERQELAARARMLHGLKKLIDANAAETSSIEIAQAGAVEPLEGERPEPCEEMPAEEAEPGKLHATSPVEPRESDAAGKPDEWRATSAGEPDESHAILEKPAESNAASAGQLCEAHSETHAETRAETHGETLAETQAETRSETHAETHAKSAPRLCEAQSLPAGLNACMSQACVLRTERVGHQEAFREPAMAESLGLPREERSLTESLVCAQKDTLCIQKETNFAKREAKFALLKRRERMWLRKMARKVMILSLATLTQNQPKYRKNLSPEKNSGRDFFGTLAEFGSVSTFLGKCKGSCN